MKNRWFYLFIVGSALTVSCAGNKNALSGSAAGNISVNGKLWASLWQQRADEYKALCYQAYNLARLRLDQELQQPHSKPLAIVTDLDETVLDNSPYAVTRSLQGLDYEPASWYAWTGEGQADTLAGSTSFFKYAASKGVTIFYITNREAKEEQGTLRNLQKFNFPNADAAHLLLKTAGSSKEARRLDVLKTHQIVLFLGDNLSDFAVVFDKQNTANREAVTKAQATQFGKNFIVLPNATYGDWEGALYQYNYNLTPMQKEEIIKKSVIGDK